MERCREPCPSGANGNEAEAMPNNHVQNFEVMALYRFLNMPPAMNYLNRLLNVPPPLNYMELPPVPPLIDFRYEYNFGFSPNNWENNPLPVTYVNHRGLDIQNILPILNPQAYMPDNQIAISIKEIIKPKETLKLPMKPKKANTLDANEPLEPNYIDDLHVIFFEQIFEQLEDLGDQVRMARAYPQFMDSILRMWRRSGKYKAVGPSTVYWQILDYDDYAFFMREMAPHFEEFSVDEDGWGPFAKFQTYTRHLLEIRVTYFPKVEVATLHGDPDTMVDDDIHSLTVIIPNLKRLDSHMNISGEHLKRFTKLEEVSFTSIYQSAPLSSFWMQRDVMNMASLRVLNITDNFESRLFLHNINLPNLEVLKINLNSFEDIVDEVLRLPKLNKICVRYDNSRKFFASSVTVFQQIIAAKSESITAISLNNEILQLPNDWYEDIQLPLPRLRKLVCKNWLGHNFFLDKPYVPFDQLKVLSFSGWMNLNYNRLPALVRECVELENLHLNGCHSVHNALVEAFNKIRASSNNRKPLNVSIDKPRSETSIDENGYCITNNHVRMPSESGVFEFQENGFDIEYD